MWSSLCKEFYPAHRNNYYGDRGSGYVNKIIIHHMAAVWTAQRCGESFQNPYRRASSNYGIGYDGTIAGYVPEELCSGATGGYEIDKYAITIEVSNSINTDPWTVSDKALTSLIQLIADIARRYKFGTLVKGQNVCWHKMYAATKCPGQYLLKNMDKIIHSANEINNMTGARGYYKGFNVSRSENALCVYTAPYKKAPTNRYGCEIACDRNGVAICDSVYGKGGMKIPKSGRVYSAHGEAVKFIYPLKEGYRMWIENGRVYFNTDVHKTLDGINTARHANELIMYRGVKSTGTNKHGVEALVINGIVKSIAYGISDNAVPSNGFILSAHGDAMKWLYAHIKVGDKIEVDGNVIIVR